MWKPPWVGTPEVHYFRVAMLYVQPFALRQVPQMPGGKVEVRGK